MLVAALLPGNAKEKEKNQGVACAKKGLYNINWREKTKDEQRPRCKETRCSIRGKRPSERPRSEFHELCMHTRLVSKEESTEQGGESTMTDD